MKFINYTVVKFSLFLTIGILTAYYLQGYSTFFFYLTVGCFLLLLLSWQIAKNQLQPSVFFGIISFGCLFCIGYVNYQLRLPGFQTNHFSNYIAVTPVQSIQLKIREILKPNLYASKYIAEMKALNGKSTSGRILLSIQKDTTDYVFPTDAVLLVYSEVKEIPKSLNPNQFEYSDYLKSLGVYHQLKIKESDILNRLDGTWTLRGVAEKFRNDIIKKLQKTALKTDERAIVQALVLGQRNDITKETYEAYAAAGAIHILAVSGLHVGILFLLLSGILRPLELFKHGALTKAILILLLLWVFALVAGLSPSVVRAVTMFSFFTFANASRRPTNSINTLFLSYFVLLLINPNWLFHVGFQLSYLAVFFILWIQPRLYKMYFPKNYILKKVWSIFTVTVAAQLGIFPLSLYYFHQFPGLFLLTNLVVLPFLGILLGGGILIVLLAVFNILPERIAATYNWLVETLNAFIGWIAQQEDFLFEDIPFSESKMMASYAMTITLVLLWKKFNYPRLASCLFCFGLFTAVLLVEKENNSRQQLVVFHKSRQTLIGYKHGASLFLFRSDSISNHENTYPIKSYKVARQIENISEMNLPSYFTYMDKNILVLDSLGVYPNSKTVDIVILTHNSKVFLERILDSLSPELVIANSTNYPSYVSRWRKTCEKRKLPFHHTGTHGAFVIE